MKYETLRAFGKIKNPEAIQELISWYEKQNDQDYFHYPLALAFEEIGGEQAAAFLVSELGQSIKNYEFSALIKIGKPVVKPLLGRFSGFSEELQGIGLDIFEKTGLDAASLNTLSGFIPDCTSAIQKRIASLLEKNEYVPQKEEEKCWYLIAKRDYARVVPFGPAALAKLNKHLFTTEFDDDKEIQAGAAAMLKIDHQTGLEFLLKAVKESHFSNMKNVLKVLAKKKIQEAIPDLIDLLESEWANPRPDVRVELMSTLANMRAYQIEPFLFEMLSSKNEKLRKAAVKNLLKFPQNQRITAALIRAVEEANRDDLDNLNMLRDALIKIGAVEAVPVLLAAYVGRARTNRKFLAKFGQDAVPYLEEALNHPDKSVRANAHDFLEDLGWKPESGETGARYHIAKQNWKSVRALGKAALEPLYEVLNSDSQKIRLGAVNTLGEICVPDAILHLIPVLDDDDTDIRQAAAQALLKIINNRNDISAPDTIAGLIPLLEDGNNDIRRAAMQILMKIFDIHENPLYLTPFVEKNNKVENLITEVENSGNDQLRMKLVKVLGHAFDPRAVRCLRKTLLDWSAEVRLEAVNVLDNFGESVWSASVKGTLQDFGKLKSLNDPRLALFDLLAQNLEGGKSFLRLNTLKVLEQLIISSGKRDSKKEKLLLNRALKDSEAAVRLSAARILKDADETPDLNLLFPLLDHSKKSVRLETISLLGEIGDAAAAKPLLQQLSDEDHQIRLETLKALGRIEAILDPQVFIQLLADEDCSVRLEAVKILGKIASPAAFEPLLPFISDADLDIRVAAVLALGQVKDSRACEPLIARLDEKESEMKRAVIQALGELGDSSVVEVLLQQLSGSDKNFTNDLILALGSYAGDPRVVEALIRLVDETGTDTIRSLGQALWKAREACQEKDSAEIDQARMKNASKQSVGEIVGNPDYGRPNINVLAAKIRNAGEDERRSIAADLVSRYPMHMADGFRLKKRLSGIIDELDRIDRSLSVEIKAADRADRDAWSDEFDRRSR